MNTVIKGIVIAVAMVLSTQAMAEPNSLQVYRALVRDGRAASGPRLHHAEIAAAQQWARTGAAASLAGANGEVLYAYGQSHPRVLCAPLHLCVVALLPGERIVNLSLGDSVRWLIQPVQAGKRPVVVIKPTTAGLETNLVITTDDGHLYYLTLVSRPTRFVPEIGFYDPKALVETVTSAQALKAQRAREEAQTVVATLPHLNPADLDFAYWWKGPRQYRPVRVFSAQGKVYIQMPASLRFGNAPAVFVVEQGAEQLVNYQVVGPYFVVDALFKEARLILGVGEDRRVVTIHAGKKPPFSW